LKVTIIGLGLIGGSIARSLKRSGDVCITAVDNNEQVLLDAVSLGVIDRKASVYDFEDSDVVYLCLYPDAALEFTEKNKNRFGKNTVLTDNSPPFLPTNGIPTPSTITSLSTLKTTMQT